METAIFDLCKWGWNNGASACVHLLNALYFPTLQSCQWKHLYYEVQLLGILCALAHPLYKQGRKRLRENGEEALSILNGLPKWVSK